MDASSLNYFIRFRQVTVIINDTNFMTASENSLGVWTTIWPDFTFRKWRSWWFCLRHPLELCHDVPPCRTNAVTYSSPLQIFYSCWKIKNKSGSKLSVHTIIPQNDICEWFTTFRLHGINHLFPTTHVILLWSQFLVTTTALLFLNSLVTPLK